MLFFLSAAVSKKSSPVFLQSSVFLSFGAGVTSDELCECVCVPFFSLSLVLQCGEILPVFPADVLWK